MISPILQQRIPNNKEVFFFCKVEITNLNMPDIPNKVVVLFDSVHKQLVYQRRLNLQIIYYENVKFARFSERNPQISFRVKV